MNVLSLITCKTTNKSYVCIAKHGEINPKKDFNPLKYGHGTIFTRAVKKHGFYNFDIKIIGHSYKTRKDLYIAEREAIEKYNTIHPNGYNIRSSGYGPEFGPEHGRLIKLAQSTPEVQERMSIANSKNARTPESLKRVSNQMKMQWKDKKFRNKMKQTMKENWNNPIRKEKHKKRISKYMKLWWSNPIVKEKQKIAFKKRSLNLEYRKKLSIALLGNKNAVKVKKGI